MLCFPVPVGTEPVYGKEFSMVFTRIVSSFRRSVLHPVVVLISLVVASYAAGHFLVATLGVLASLVVLAVPGGGIALIVLLRVFAANRERDEALGRAFEKYVRDREAEAGARCFRR